MHSAAKKLHGLKMNKNKAKITDSNQLQGYYRLDQKLLFLAGQYK